jgi:hypothetical protein
MTPCICEPDEDDIAALDEMSGHCDCDFPEDCWGNRGERYPERCFLVEPRPLIDDIDAEDMAGLDDPRSLAALEAMAA